MSLLKPKISEQITALQADVAERNTQIEALQAQVEAVTGERDTLAEQVENTIAPETLAEAEARAEQAERNAAESAETLDGVNAELETAKGKLNLRVLADASEGAPAVEDGGAGDGASILDEWAKVRGTEGAHDFWKENKSQILDAGRA